MADDLAYVLAKKSPVVKLLTTVVRLRSLQVLPQPLPLLLLLLLLLSIFVVSGEVAGLYPRLLVLLHLVPTGSPSRALACKVAKTPLESLVLPLVVVVATATMAAVAEVEPPVLLPPPVLVPSILAQTIAVVGKIAGLHSRLLLRLVPTRSS